MNNRELIAKTIREGRGYKLKAYRTEIENDIFSLFHYGTLIFRVNGDRQIIDIEHYGGYSQSDTAMIRIALSEFGIRNYRATHGTVVKI